LRSTSRASRVTKPAWLSDGLERGFVVDQGSGDAVARRAGLAGFATTMDIDLDVEGFDMVAGQRPGVAWRS
jgi:hypothetical protein